jgi:hypothetical protein
VFPDSAADLAAHTSVTGIGKLGKGRSEFGWNLRADLYESVFSHQRDFRLRPASRCPDGKLQQS